MSARAALTGRRRAAAAAATGAHGAARSSSASSFLLREMSILCVAIVVVLFFLLLVYRAALRPWPRKMTTMARFQHVDWCNMCFCLVRGSLLFSVLVLLFISVWSSATQGSSCEDWDVFEAVAKPLTSRILSPSSH